MKSPTQSRFGPLAVKSRCTRSGRSRGERVGRRGPPGFAQALGALNVSCPASRAPSGTAPWRTTIADAAARATPDLVERDFSARLLGRLVGRGPLLPALLGRATGVLRIRHRRLQPPDRRLAIRSHMRTDLVLVALRMALSRRGQGADVELVHHSDAGSQYTSIDYSQALDDHDLLASIGTVGDAYDNATAESFFDSFKTELIPDRVSATKLTARARHRRVGRLVQRQPPPQLARRPPALRVRAAPRRPSRDFGATDRSRRSRRRPADRLYGLGLSAIAPTTRKRLCSAIIVPGRLRRQTIT